MGLPKAKFSKKTVMTILIRGYFTPSFLAKVGTREPNSRAERDALSPATRQPYPPFEHTLRFEGKKLRLPPTDVVGLSPKYGNHTKFCRWYVNPFTSYISSSG
jgi:hypothetical protein